MAVQSESVVAAAVTPPFAIEEARCGPKHGLGRAAKRQRAPAAAQTAENSSFTWVSRIELPEGSRKPESIP